MTTSTTSSDGLRLTESTFNIVATVGAVVLALIALVVLWTGYQDSTLPVLGTELSLVKGVVGFMLTMFFAIGAFIVAAFMELGWDY
ncbi:hypothetical protein [Halopiger goleimassiliensis]|uniref:hypothetical protein n=1 Tax=Halopiger goleimassiliensis TaxID=1293048 RepID=UPI0009DC14EA|nr:hypothetical protein [Halopiger goleimassiliensis]